MTYVGTIVFCTTFLLVFFSALSVVAFVATFLLVLCHIIRLLNFRLLVQQTSRGDAGVLGI
jgi:hypothetical protein